MTTANKLKEREEFRKIQSDLQRLIEEDFDYTWCGETDYHVRTNEISGFSIPKVNRLLAYIYNEAILNEEFIELEITTKEEYLLTKAVLQSIFLSIIDKAKDPYPPYHYDSKLYKVVKVA